MILRVYETIIHCIRTLIPIGHAILCLYTYIVLVLPNYDKVILNRGPMIKINILNNFSAFIEFSLVKLIYLNDCIIQIMIQKLIMEYCYDNVNFENNLKIWSIFCTRPSRVVVMGKRLIKECKMKKKS